MTHLADAAAALNCDIFLFNGEVRRGFDMECIQEISRSKTSDRVLLIPVTNGGDPDAAFKVSRYIQSKYDHFTVLISGLCKSAGTLLALGAHDMVFMPYGELGPLDIQLTRIDRFEQMQSGLVISDSLTTLEERALAVYYNTVRGLLGSNQGMISFATASAAAVEAMKAIYGPVLSRIDPEEIGVRARAMRIAQDYGKRLEIAGRNLKPDTLTLLSEKYPSHSFVIDYVEAATMFERVRLDNEQERLLVDLLGPQARYQGREPIFNALHEVAVDRGEANDDQADAAGDAAADGGDSSGADAAPDAAAGGENPERDVAAE